MQKCHCVCSVLLGNVAELPPVLCKVHKFQQNILTNIPPYVILYLVRVYPYSVGKRKPTS